MRKSYIFFVLIFISWNTSGQIAGISGSKLRSYCVDVVDHHKVELEPSLYYGQSRRHWNDESDLEDTFSTADSINRFSGIAMRITYGLFDKLEVGMAVPLDMKTGYFGMRYVLLQKKSYGLAAIAGFNVPMGQGTYKRGYRSEDDAMQLGLGGVFSYQKGENFSLDYNLEYDNFLSETVSTKKGTVYTSVDVGYYFFNHQLQLIGSVGYEYSDMGNGLNQNRLTLYPGVTIETGKHYIIVLAAPFDVYGRNVNKTAGFAMALTLTLN